MQSADPARAKTALRVRLRAARARRSGPDAATALADQVPALLRLASPGPVAAYASTGGEPPTDLLRAGLRAAGTTVLLPVLLDDDDLDWAVDTGTQLVPGRRGTRHPAGERCGRDAVAGCGLVVVPALAVGRDGGRLGQGGGSYDRALARVPAGVPVVAVVWPDEVLDAVPVAPHDRPVDGWLTTAGLTPVQRPGGRGGRA